MKMPTFRLMKDQAVTKAIQMFPPFELLNCVERRPAVVLRGFILADRRLTSDRVDAGRRLSVLRGFILAGRRSNRVDFGWRPAASTRFWREHLNDFSESLVLHKSKSRHFHLAILIL